MPTEYGGDTLHEWMQKYWSMQVKNPQATAFLPDGLGGVRLVSSALRTIANQADALRTADIRKRLRADRPKMKKRARVIKRVKPITFSQAQ